MTQLKSLFVIALTCALCSVAIDLQAVGAVSEPGSDVKLERVPPMSPEKSLASTEVADGFRMELVAAEPLVVDPVAMSFDEVGRLYVVEMVDYSEQDKERLGLVRLLSDDDGDGRFETSQVFLDDLSWPTAVICYDGGVFIGDAPDILYCKDTDGDGKADVRRVIFTGFSRKNVQGLLNSFQWGLDHRIWGATSTSGAQLTRPGQTSPPLDLRGRDFCFDPKTLEIAPTTGGGQHGLTFNRWGDRFVCHNSDHLQGIVFEERYLARNPYQSVVSARRSIASDGPQAPVFRISPVEGWREARTKLRVAGLAPGPVEGGGRAAGYFTSGTGVTVYEGDLWPNHDESTVLVADVGSNLIHRKRLVQNGVTYRGDRIDKDSEFVRSRDLWFRPVQMANSPDGGLYVADMYREVIEHPDSLPSGLKKQLDLTSGRDRGRIYRIVPADYQYSRPKSLAKASPAELIDALDDANQWRRMTALRLIYERPNSDYVRLLRLKSSAARRPEGRIAILYALDSLGALNEADLTQALKDAHPQVRRHAIRLAEPLLDRSIRLRENVLSLMADSDPVVQFQLALSLGECRDSSATKALAAILIRSSKSSDIVEAALTSIVNRAGDVLSLLLGDEKWAASASAEPVLSAIVGQIARQRRDEDISILTNFLSQSSSKRRSASAAALLKALSRLPAGTLGSGNSPRVVKLQALRQSAAKSLIHEAQQVLERSDASLDDRVAAVEDLALDKFDNQHALLESLLSPQEPAAIHTAVLATCAQYVSPGVAKLILSQWQQFSPSERSQATELLLRRAPWSLELVHYLSDQNLRITTLEPAHAARLENYPSAKVREIARKLRGQGVSEDRQQVFKEYRDVLTAKGDAAQGKLVFEKNCASCHEVGGVGHAVGPNLAAMVSRGAESVLFNVLAPSMEIDPRFLEYVVLTADGQVINGVIAGETSTAVTLRAADNKTTTVLRVDIDDMHNTGKSLMPEGFEKVIDKKSMSNLLAFLQQTATQEATK